MSLTLMPEPVATGSIASPGPTSPSWSDAQVEAGAPVGDQQGRELRLVERHADLEAGHARLGDLEDGAADPVAVADADLGVGEPVDGEVLAEAPEAVESSRPSSRSQ